MYICIWIHLNNNAHKQPSKLANVHKKPNVDSTGKRKMVSFQGNNTNDTLSGYYCI